MSVWLTIPSKRPPGEIMPVIAAWGERGYKIALWRDDAVAMSGVSLTLVNPGFPYPGYAVAVNELIVKVLELDPQAEWLIAAGDDTYPDPNKTADEIARECRDHFEQRLMDYCDGGLPWSGLARTLTGEQMQTFGVMQPTGDRWQEGQGGFKNAPIDRVAGSAWIGREFARRMYQGKGPLYAEYTHCFVDEELQEVAIKYGVFWQRRDLTHLHKHWARGKGLHDLVDASNCPAFLAEANSGAHWEKYSKLFKQRKAEGFPGSEPL